MRNQSVPWDLQEEAATWVWGPLVSGAVRESMCGFLKSPTAIGNKTALFDKSGFIIKSIFHVILKNEIEL